MESRDRYRIAFLSAYALALHGFEAMLPSPVPWFRLGLSNIVTLMALYLYGLGPALMVTLIRVFLGSLFLGTFLGPAFFMSLGGGLVSTISMGAVLRTLPGIFSPLGISLVGAMLHNLAQLFIAYFMFIQRIEAVLIIVPIMTGIGTITGIINGLAAKYLLNEIHNKSRSSD